MIKKFPLFQTPIDLAHRYWQWLIEPEDTAIDATCGNGQDALFLAKLPLKRLLCIDLQAQAIQETEKLLKRHLSEQDWEKIQLHQGCHAQFPSPWNEVKLIVYNLGYLPRGNKELTTQSKTTLESLNNAMAILAEGGAISITCYPGHSEGAREEEMLLDYLKSLDTKNWSICHHRWVNRNRSPSLFLLQKS